MATPDLFAAPDTGKRKVRLHNLKFLALIDFMKAWLAEAGRSDFDEADIVTRYSDSDELPFAFTVTHMQQVRTYMEEKGLIARRKAGKPMPQVTIPADDVTALLAHAANLHTHAHAAMASLDYALNDLKTVLEAHKLLMLKLPAMPAPT